MELSLPLTVRDSSLTLTQFCTRLKTFLFTRAYGTSSQRLRDSLGCKDSCANINFLTYLLTHSLTATLAPYPDLFAGVPDGCFCGVCCPAMGANSRSRRGSHRELARQDWRAAGRRRRRTITATTTAIAARHVGGGTAVWISNDGRGGGHWHARVCRSERRHAWCVTTSRAPVDSRR